MDKYKWDLSKMIRDEAHFESEVSDLKGLYSRIKMLEADFKQNFKDYISTITEAERRVGHIFAFAKMTFDENTRDPKGQKYYQAASNLLNDYYTSVSSLNPNILSLDKAEFDRLIKDNDMENYRLYLERIYRFKDHTLSEAEERVISSFAFLAAAPTDSYELLTNADLHFDELESTDTKLSHATFIGLLRNPDVKIRKEAFEKYYKAYASVANTISSMYLNNVKALTSEAALRKYESAVEMELFKDDVKLDVYESMIEACHENLDKLSEYYDIKGRYLGLKEQHMYDVYLPMVKGAGKKYSFEEAKETVLKSLAPLGDEYVKVAKEGFESNWIDVYPKEGKASGAYSYGSYDSDPYIMMNFNDDFESMFTLAHELGHSMHSYFSRHNNEYVYSDYTTFVAEVASTTNELLLLNYLLKNCRDKDEEIQLINHYLDSFKSTVFRQTMFAEFEKICHERIEKGDILTLEDFNQIYYDLNKLYYGENVISDETIRYEWTRIPHFFMNFYVYKYATGFSTAVKLSQNILSGDPKKVAAYLNFLKDGSNNYPLDQLRAAGADISKKENINSSLKVFRDLVDRMKDLLLK
ncbi:oligoendopeptidase F [Peptoniphilus sp. GNH]|nr:oligoendopeptidase F [Clostridiales bacterium KA00134]UHR01939.1 oligoendopeptidase F [Peptoniphilus sp. GNH]